MTQLTLIICPRCSTRHDATARFCPSCGLDYRAIAEGTGKRRRGWSGGERTLAGVIVLIALGGFLYATGAATIPGLDGPGAPGAASTDLPPAGTIWFGSTFDAETFEIRGRTDTVTTTETFALVGRLPRSLDGSELVIRAALDGQQVYNQAADSSDVGELWGFTYGPVFAPGTWTIQMTDIGGNVLASGDVTATE